MEDAGKCGIPRNSGDEAGRERPPTPYSGANPVCRPEPAAPLPRRGLCFPEHSVPDKRNGLRGAPE